MGRVETPSRPMGFGSETGAEIGAGSFSVAEVGHPDPPRSLGTPAERENRKTHQRSRGGCLRGICPAQNRLSQNSGKRPSMGAAQVPGPRDRSHRRWGRSIWSDRRRGRQRGEYREAHQRSRSDGLWICPPFEYQCQMGRMRPSRGTAQAPGPRLRPSLVEIGGLEFGRAASGGARVKDIVEMVSRSKNGGNSRIGGQVIIDRRASVGGREVPEIGRRLLGE